MGTVICFYVEQRASWNNYFKAKVQQNLTKLKLNLSRDPTIRVLDISQKYMLFTPGHMYKNHMYKEVHS